MDGSTSAAPANLDLLVLGRAAWSQLARRPGTYVVAWLCLLAGTVVSLGIAGPALLVGLIRLIERDRRGEPVAIGHMLDGFAAFSPALLAGAALLAGTVLGSLLIVLPGLAVAVMWAFAPWFVALDGQRGATALRSAWALARDHLGSVLLVLVAVAGLNILGGVVVVGLLVSGPLGLIFMTLCFHELRGG
jgi:hypothetical protein